MSWWQKLPICHPYLPWSRNPYELTQQNKTLEKKTYTHTHVQQKQNTPIFNQKTPFCVGMIQQIYQIIIVSVANESPKELHWGPVPGGGQFLGTGGCTAEGVMFTEELKCSCGVLCDLVLKVLVIYVGLHINTYKYRYHIIYIYVCKHEIYYIYMQIWHTHLRYDTYLYIYIYRVCWIGYMLVSDLWYWEALLSVRNYSWWLVMCSSFWSVSFYGVHGWSDSVFWLWLWAL